MNVQDKLLTKPNHVVSLATSCLLVTPVVHVWTATMQDSEISEEVTAAKKADKDSGKFVKNLLAKNPQHRKILIYRQTVYNWMQVRTYDWAGKQRILPVIGLTKFMTESSLNLSTDQAVIQMKSFLREMGQPIDQSALRSILMSESDILRERPPPPQPVVVIDTVDEVNNKITEQINDKKRKL